MAMKHAKAVTVKSKQTSLKKVAANRLNARRSTGPRSAKGKEVAKWNALKHGLLAKSAVIPIGDGKEDPEEFRIVLQTLSQQYKPVGMIEEMLVERIAVSYWRLRRVQLAEVGEIQKNLCHAWTFPKYERESRTWKRLSAPALPGENIYLELCSDSNGLNHLIAVLERARKEISESCAVSDATRETILYYFPKTDVRFHLLDERASVKQLADGIERAISNLQERRKYISDHEYAQDYAQVDASRVPASSAARKLIRYETAIERQLFRAIGELERLQGIRLFQPVRAQ